MQFEFTQKNILTIPFCSEFPPGSRNNIKNSILPFSIGLRHFFSKMVWRIFDNNSPGFLMIPFLHHKAYSILDNKSLSTSVQQSSVIAICNPFLKRPQVLGLFYYVQPKRNLTRLINCPFQSIPGGGVNAKGRSPLRTIFFYLVSGKHT